MLTTRPHGTPRAALAAAVTLALSGAAGLRAADKVTATFACTGEAFLVQNLQAELSLIDPSTSPFAFLPIADLQNPPGTPIEVNNLGFRSTDGLLYALQVDAGAGTNSGILQIDGNGNVSALGRPAGLPANVAFNAGDVSTDGNTLFLTHFKDPNLWLVDLSGVPALPAATAVPITGAGGGPAPGGIVLDWAYHPIDGKLYGADRDGANGAAQIAQLDPATGVRRDFTVAGLPGGAPRQYGGAWFNGAGRLFVFLSSGTIFEIDLGPLASPSPTIAGSQSGPGSNRNDAAACIQDVLGAAQQMSVSAASLPATLTIDYTFESFSPVDDLSALSTLDDLGRVFGVEGVDWTFTAIRSVPAAFANPAFDGSLVTELVNQAPAQSLPPGAAATVTVEIELLSLAALAPDDTFCDQVLALGQTPDGFVVGDFSAAGTDPDPNGDGFPGEQGPTCVSVVPNPSLALVKTGVFNNENGDVFAQEGETISYTFEVTNDGNLPLTGVTVVDPLVPTVVCPGGQPIPTLATGAAVTCTGSYALLQLDVDLGRRENTATATGEDPGGGAVSVEDTETVSLQAPPLVLQPAVCTGEAFIVQKLQAELSRIDRTVDPFVLDPIGNLQNPPGTLIEANNLGFRRTDGLLYAVEVDLNANTNAGILQIDGNGRVVHLGSPPGLPSNVGFNAGEVSADGGTFYLNQSGRGRLYAVDLASFTQTSVAITGDTAGAANVVLDWAHHPVDGLLYGADRGGQLARLDPATGVRTDFAVAGLPAGADFGGAWFDASGALFLFDNSGEVFEVGLGDLSSPTPVVVGSQTGPSSGRNDAAACLQEVVGSAKRMTTTEDGLPETVTLDYVFENLSATDTLSAVSALDDLSQVFGVQGVDWTFTSIGSLPASFANPTFDGGAVIELVNQAPAQDLAPGASATITVEIELLTFVGIHPDNTFCNQVVAVGQVPGGVLVGDLSTEGLDPDPDGDGFAEEQRPACVSFAPTPALSLVKTGVFNDVSGDGRAQAGETISYTFGVTNTGNVGLTDVTVSDPMVSPINCPGGQPVPALAPGAKVTCNGFYVVLQADVDAGRKDNTATVTGIDPGGAPISDQDGHSVPLPRQPAIRLVKTGVFNDESGDGFAQAGETIGYTFDVTNTGNVTLSAVGVSDAMALPITCPTSVLAPAATRTCTGTYAVTQADVDAGQKDNTASASGTDPGGTVVADQDTESVSLPRQPAIRLVKTGAFNDESGDGFAQVGETIGYSFDVTNTGNVTLTGVAVSDPIVSPITCPGTVLAPGVTQTCTGTYPILVTDINAGQKFNTATASGTGSGGTDVSAEDTHLEPLPQPFQQLSTACTGEAFIVQNVQAELSLIDQTVSPFRFSVIRNLQNPPGTAIEANNLGFRRTDGLLYAVQVNLTTNTNSGILQIDGNGDVFSLGSPAGLPSNIGFNAGDLSTDGSTYYLNQSGRGRLYAVDLLSFTQTSVAITGDTAGASNVVLDWAYHPIDGRLYGADRDGEVVRLDPATGVRTDFPVAGLPVGTDYGGAWFDAAGALLLFDNSGAIFEVELGNLASPTPTLVTSESGPSSGRNDAAACIQDAIGTAKRMTATRDGLPETVTIDYVVENVDPADALSALSAVDDLTEVFGVRGVDWTFTSISSVPAAFANPAYDGDATAELISQFPTQSLAPGASATLTVVIELLTFVDRNPDGTYCNQVLAIGQTPSGVFFGDLSTDGLITDPNGDGAPIERSPSCVTFP